MKVTSPLVKMKNPKTMVTSNFDASKSRMIESQLKDRGIEDEAVINAFRDIPRHLFVPESYKNDAYADRPLPIGEGQTISQPYIVALMTELLHLTEEDKVLEIGTGSGFQTGILARIADEVFTVEKNEKLQKRARSTIKSLGIDNVNFRVGDGTVGWDEHSPYKRILGTGGVPDVPSSLVNQLGNTGLMVIPVGSKMQQRLWKVKKVNGEPTYEKGVYCSFVPLVGEQGW